MTADDVRARIRSEVQAEGGSVTSWALKRGLSQPYISDILAGNRQPGDSVLKAMGLEKIVIYQEVAKEAAA